MAISRKAVNSLGALAALAIVAGAYFGVAAPVLAEKKSVEVELQQAQQLNATYSSKLASFQGGETDEIRQATSTMDLFRGLVSPSIDLESASRAIAAALPAGVTLESFNFGQIQKVAPLQNSTLTIEGFTPPVEFTASDAATATPAEKNEESAVEDAGATKEALAPSGEQGVDPSAPTSGFNRIPFTIEVSAGSYAELASYLDSISQQPRLMSVVSIDSSRSESVSATIYAFAFSGQ